MLVVGILLMVVVCVFAMFKKQREKTKLLASGKYNFRSYLKCDIFLEYDLCCIQHYAVDILMQ